MSEALEPPVAGPVVPVLAAVCSQLDRLRAAELWRHDDAETVAVLDAAHTLVAKAQAVTMRLVADADRRDVATDAGAPSMQAWLKARYRLRPSEAKRDLELARLLARSEKDPCRVDTEDRAPREGAAVADGLWTGAVHVDQARVIGHALQELPADASVECRVQGGADPGRPGRRPRPGHVDPARASDPGSRRPRRRRPAPREGA